jgi:hypothetical protein
MSCVWSSHRRTRCAWRILRIAISGSLLAGCGLGSGAPSVYQTEESAREALRQQGAKLESQFFPQGVAWSVDLSGAKVSDETIERLQKIGHVSELNLSGSTVTDDHLAKIDEFSGVIQTIDLSNTGITDAGVGAMKRFTTLRVLKIKDTPVTPVTDAGIAQFKKNRQGTDTIKIVTKNVKIIR